VHVAGFLETAWHVNVSRQVLVQVLVLEMECRICAIYRHKLHVVV
jgi:hypothetical protein